MNTWDLWPVGSAWWFLTEVSVASLPGPLLLPRARAGLQELLGRPQHLLGNAVRSLQRGFGAARGAMDVLPPPSPRRPRSDDPSEHHGCSREPSSVLCGADFPSPPPPILLLSISRGLIVVSSNDSYYLHPLGTPEPGQHVILRAEHLPIAGGTCAHGDDFGSTVGAIARLFRPAERRVKPAPRPSCTAGAACALPKCLLLPPRAGGSRGLSLGRRPPEGV